MHVQTFDVTGTVENFLELNGDGREKRRARRPRVRMGGGARKYYSGPGYRGTRYSGRTFCFEICDPLSHMGVFHCICNFLSNVSPNTLLGGAR